MLNLFYCLSVAISLNWEFAFGQIRKVILCRDLKGSIERYGNLRNGYLSIGDNLYDEDKIYIGLDGFLLYSIVNEKVDVKAYSNTNFRIFNHNTTIFNPSIALFSGRLSVLMNQKIIDKFILDAPYSLIETTFARFTIENSGQKLFNGHRYSSITLLDGNLKVANTISGDIFFLEKGKTLLSLSSGKFIFLDNLKNNKFLYLEVTD